MAHYKRGKNRSSVSGNYSGNGLRHRLGMGENEFEISQYDTNSGYPRWWDKAFHTKPQRRKVKRLEKACLTKDAEDIIWPLAKKPHIYYW